MSSEQVAGILRQCSNEVRVVVARSVREPTTATSNSPSVSQRPSIASENLIRTTNLSSIISDNDGIINNSQKKILLRTERLLENNHNLEKILDNLLEQVCLFLFQFLSFFFLQFFFYSLSTIDIIKKSN